MTSQNLQKPIQVRNDRLTVDELKSRLDYQRGRTPLFIHKPRSIEGLTGSALRSATTTNTRFAGTAALNCPNDNGYLGGKINAITMTAHRAVWAFEHGKWPEFEIDHIDGNKTNNRIENLRDVSCKINCRNRPKRADSKYKFGGVEMTQGGSWRFNIVANGRRNWHGGFRCETSAAIAKKQKQTKFGYTLEHGS